MTARDKIGYDVQLDGGSVPSAGTILLVDDDSSLCELIGDVLTGAGFTMETVLDGGRGLARAIEGGL